MNRTHHAGECRSLDLYGNGEIGSLEIELIIEQGKIEACERYDQPQENSQRVCMVEDVKSNVARPIKWTFNEERQSFHPSQKDASFGIRHPLNLLLRRMICLVTS